MLASEGFGSIEELAMVDEKEIAGIEGFDEETAKELQDRAKEYLEKQEGELDAKRVELGVEDAVKDVPGITTKMLVALGENGVMTGKGVGAHTHMHKTKVSRAVAHLEERKFIARRANRADLRESFLSLTPAGRAVYEELAPSALAFMDRLAEVVAPADRPAFDRAVKQLTKRSSELVAEIESGKI